MWYFNILAVTPFLYIIYSLIIKKQKTTKVMIITYFLTSIILFIFWQMNYEVLLSASIKGIFQALEIFLIIFAILLLFNLLKNKKKLEQLKNFILTFSNDKNVLIILIGFFLVSFFESIAGFGTPAAICVPILIYLGVKPLRAVIICLVADSVAVAFGAFGVPLTFGIVNSVSEANIEQIKLYIGIINGFIAIFLPTLLILLYNILEKKPLKNIKKYLPFTFFSGFSFAIPFFLASLYLNPELVSVVASIIGLSLALIYIKFIGIETSGHKKHFKKSKFSEFFYSFTPYLVIIGLLVASRLNLFEFKTLLQSIGFNLELFEGIKFSFSFYTPGILILFVFILFVFIYKISKKEFIDVIETSFNQGKNALIVLIFTLAFVQILIFSNLNSIGMLSIPQIIGSLFSKTGVFYLIMSPLIGAFGAFITGSATVSNLIFSPLQYEVSQISIFSTSLVLAMQSVGASLGNMIAIHNIIAACSLAGIKNKESQIISINFKIMLVLVVIGVILGYVVHYLV